MATNKQPVLSDEQRHLSKFIAIVVRNAMEDFHCQHLTDEQMQQLNPIIRNAIATALHAFDYYEQADAAKQFVEFNFKCIPAYWEQSELLPGYVEMWRRREK